MQLRQSQLVRLGSTSFDVLVVGGGINGAVSAAALSARGLKVALIDKRDFAGFTSQESSNLAWGGIKYMESMEFGLVRKLCLSRNRLMREYPSTVQEIRFFTSLQKGFRYPAWFLYLGSLVYWLMGNGVTRLPRYLTRSGIQQDEAIIDTTAVSAGFEYSDCYLYDNDARFVFNFVRGALDHGCAAANYVASESAFRQGGYWHVSARDQETGSPLTIRARVLINACGPFVDEHNQLSGQQTRHRHVFSKGIHLIVDRLTPNRRVLTFFADDGRLFFVIPMGPRTCIGTTDTRVSSPLSAVTSEDRRFVLDNINKRLRLSKPLTDQDVVAERCGVRPLVVEVGQGQQEDWLQMSRKHVIEANISDGHLSIYGGKLTDCLNVGEEVCAWMEKLGLPLPFPERKWYGEPPAEVRENFFHRARLMGLDQMTPASSSEPLSSRLWRRYGTEAFNLLEQIRVDPKEAELVIENAEYLRCEIEQAARREMVTRLDDFLRRRSKIALVVPHTTIAQAEGLHEACALLFGTAAQEKYEGYFAAQAEHSPEVGT
jgi:glycerol-3-phosphate dehydrogenase